MYDMYIVHMYQVHVSGNYLLKYRKNKAIQVKFVLQMYIKDRNIYVIQLTAYIYIYTK